MSELMGALEEIRASEFPDIPQELLERIVTVHFENQDNRVQARAETMKLVAEYLKTITEPGKEE